jgi:hypothetical protein
MYEISCSNRWESAINPFEGKVSKVLENLGRNVMGTATSADLWLSPMSGLGQ